MWIDKNDSQSTALSELLHAVRLIQLSSQAVKNEALAHHAL
jgi:hypothetical protein